MQEFRSLELAIKQYQIIKNLKLKGEVRSQIERASLSVCLNLSEGNGKLTAKDRARFFNISYASQQEVKCLLKILNLVYLLDLADKLAAHLYRLQQQARDG